MVNSKQVARRLNTSGIFLSPGPLYLKFLFNWYSISHVFEFNKQRTFCLMTSSPRHPGNEETAS